MCDSLTLRRTRPGGYSAARNPAASQLRAAARSDSARVASVTLAASCTPLRPAFSSISCGRPQYWPEQNKGSSTEDRGEPRLEASDRSLRFEARLDRTDWR